MTATIKSRLKLLFHQCTHSGSSWRCLPRCRELGDRSLHAAATGGERCLCSRPAKAHLHEPAHGGRVGLGSARRRRAGRRRQGRRRVQASRRRVQAAGRWRAGNTRRRRRRRVAAVDEVEVIQRLGEVAARAERHGHAVLAPRARDALVPGGGGGDGAGRARAWVQGVGPVGRAGRGPHTPRTHVSLADAGAGAAPRDAVGAIVHPKQAAKNAVKQVRAARPLGHIA